MSVDTLARAWIDGVIAGSPVARHLGVEIVDATQDRVRVRLPYDDALTTVPGVIHGGVIAIRDRRSERHVVLVRQLPQEEGQGRQEHHERGYASRSA